MDAELHEMALAQARLLAEMLESAVGSQPELGIGFVLGVVVPPGEDGDQPFLMSTNSSELGQVCQLVARILEEAARRDAKPLIHTPDSLH